MTAIYHYMFVPLTLGLALMLAIMETMWVKTGDQNWLNATKFWMKLFGITIRIHRAEMFAPTNTIQVETRWKRLLTLFQPKNMTATKVDSKKSIMLASVFGLISILLTMYTGDSSAQDVTKTQPMKFAAMEGLNKGD